ncbi:MAG: hypothetical protein M3Q07_06225 [Pseudobdellovibrionaceae bacterium]|nr:hypothetical protein [Pseudobdellovibrionaceae bacterium]
MKYLVCWLLFVTDVALACVGMNAQQLQDKLKQEPAEQLVFFASWCASCKKHLTPESLKASYFIAVFDEQSAAEKAYSAFLGETNLKRCVWDQDGSIAAAYGVKSLPVVRALKP